MTKEIIETEIERLFPQFNRGEVVAGTMAAEWMQERMRKKVCEWIMTTPMYAKQPSQLVAEFRKAMGE